MADNQFSTLGIVLMATLARLVKVTGFTGERPTLTRTRKSVQKTITITPVEDLGQRIRRGDDNQGSFDKPAMGRAPSDHRMDGQRDSAGPPDGVTKRTKRTKTESKKRKKNAIDDLFSGLL